VDLFNPTIEALQQWEVSLKYFIDEMNPFPSLSSTLLSGIPVIQILCIL
jgi:hypothetical protein